MSKLRQFIVFGLWSLVILACVLFAAYTCRAPLLTGLANAYIVNEPLQKADAILVPGGGIGWRPIEAARLYQEGYAPKILVLDVKRDTSVAMGLRESEGAVMRQVLIGKGVPATNIVTVGQGVSSTFGDINAACDWAKTSGAKRLIIPTDFFHTRRLKWVANKVLTRNGLESEVRAVIPPEYAPTNWWQHEEGVIMFQNELIKFGFYRVKYRGG